MANSTRLCPSMRIMTTVVSPARPPILISVASQGCPTARKASASGAEMLSVE